MADSKFDQWNVVKKSIQENQGRQKIKEGCVYWVSVGQNIGHEVFGKGPEFKRPVLVLKRIYIPNYINTFIGIPLTTTENYGFSFCKITNTATGKKVVAMLAQVRAFDEKRIINYYYRAKKEDVERIIRKLFNLLSPSN